MGGIAEASDLHILNQDDISSLQTNLQSKEINVVIKKLKVR